MCETECSFFRTGKTGLARIHVIHLYETGIDGPVLCIQCKERYCLDCPSNAIQIGNHGEIIVSPTKCTLCEACISNCPIGAIQRYGDHIYVCDLCGGSPRCVDACTEGAIIYLPEKSEQISLAHFKDNSGTKNTSERMEGFIEYSGMEMRKKWRKKNA